MAQPTNTAHSSAEAGSHPQCPQTPRRTKLQFSSSSSSTFKATSSSPHLARNTCVFQPHSVAGWQSSGRAQPLNRQCSFLAAPLTRRSSRVRDGRPTDHTQLPDVYIQATSFACRPPQRQHILRACESLGRVSARRPAGAAHRTACSLADLPHHLVRRRIGRILLRAPAGAPKTVTQAVAAPQPKPLPGCALNTLARTRPRNPTREPPPGGSLYAERPFLPTV